MISYSEITFKYLKAQKKRTILTIVGIILSVALITSIGTMFMSYRGKAIRQEKINSGDYHISFDNIKGESVNRVKNDAQVESSGVISRYSFAIISKTSEKEKKENQSAAPYRYLDVKSYDLNALKMFNIKLKEGRFPENSNEIIINPRSLDFFEKKPKLEDKINLDLGIRNSSETGKEVDYYGARKDEFFEKTQEKEYKVVGFIEEEGYFSSNDFIFQAITFDDNKNINVDKRYSVFTKMNSTKNIGSKARKIAKNIGVSSTSIGNEETRTFQGSKESIQYNNSLLRLYGNSAHKNINSSIFLILAFIISLIVISSVAVIYNTFNISVLERISQFGILRCVGASPSQIKKIILKEALILSLIGIPLGLFFGTVVIQLILYVFSYFSLDFLNDVKLVISPLVLVLSGLIGLFTIFISAAGPAIQAGRVSPLDAVKNSGAVKVGNIKKVKKSRIIKAIFGIEGQFANRNLRRNKKRFRITVLSMIISIILFIVFGSFVDYGFRAGVADDGRNYTYSVDRSPTIEDSVYNEIKNIKSVDKVYKDYCEYFRFSIPKDKINHRYYNLRKSSFMVEKENELTIHNNSISSFGDDGLEAVKKNLKSGAINKDALNKENGVILVQTIDIQANNGKSVVLDITKFKVGDEINIEIGDADKKTYKKVKIMGIADKGILENKYNENECIELITTPEVFEKVTGHDNYHNVFISAKSGISHTEITDYLKKVQNNNSSYSYTDYDKMDRRNRNDNMAISIFLYGFIGVITVIGCLNISNTISTNLLLRTKEFAVLKAVGMTEYSIKKMILLEGSLYGIIAAVYGSILGTLCYCKLYNLLIGIREVPWSMPWKNIFIATFGSIFVALISSIIPMRKINTGIIVEDLRTDN